MESSSSVLSILQKRSFRLTVNWFGIFVATVGITFCIALVLGTFVVKTETKTQTSRVETKLFEGIKKVEVKIQGLEASIEQLETPEQIEQAVANVTIDATERLETFKVTLEALNFGDGLDDSIERIDRTIEKLEDLQGFSGKAEDIKVQVLFKIKKVSESIDDTKSGISDGSEVVNKLAFYLFVSSTLLTMVLLIGELSLFRRCLAGLKALRDSK